MSVKAARALGSELVKLRCIQLLDLWHVGDDAVKSLGPYLAQLTSIQQLRLGCNGFSAHCAASLGPYLAHLTSIQLLELS